MADICNPAIDCELVKNISPEQAFNMLVQEDINGCPALNTVVVDAGSSDCTTYVDCNNMSEMDWKALFFQMITIDANGCWALRIIESTL